ncbi:hypothetical protein E4T43_08174 [Aureobasidium subglaciale]|nr:hypothetical protein E4T43_08174 [Aureobasidium subglaciale]
MAFGPVRPRRHRSRSQQGFISTDTLVKRKQPGPYRDKVQKSDLQIPNGLKNTILRNISEPETTLHAHSVRRAIPEVLYALSESPNAVDDVLDLLEETKIGLLSHVASNGIKSQIIEADQEGRLSVAESTLIAQHMREEIINLLIDIVTWLEDHINKWDVTKDNLLDRMHRNMVSIDDRNLDIRDKTVDVRSSMELITSKESFQTDVATLLGKWATVLENMRHELESIGET